jgi:hypothetical protein
MPIESTQSIRPKPVTARNAVENILYHFVAAVAKVTNYFLRSRHRASDEKRPESVAKEAGALALLRRRQLLGRRQLLRP